MILDTSRLDLVAATVELVELELTDHQYLGGRLEVGVPGNWPPNEMKGVLAYFLMMLEWDVGLAGWLSWYWILRQESEDRALVGCGGFKGRPDPDGSVEIGYAVLPQYQGEGFATEAAGAILKWAFAHAEVTRVDARREPDMKASLKVLEKLGFREAETEPGGLIQYELRRENFQARSDCQSVGTLDKCS
jgi:RimJ/RimL family protein N-acetyltransferase